MVVAVVMPFQDEEDHLPAALQGLGAQTRAPDHVVLVDDGSTDGSLAVARDWARDRPHVDVLTRPPRPRGRDRLIAAGELLAFQDAVSALAVRWDVVGKLDADIVLTPRALEAVIGALEEDPRLGIAGAHLAEQRNGGALERVRARDEHVHGATSFYRRACWEEIAPLPAILGWDMIDAHRARRLGWRTASVAVPGGDPVHLRPLGAHAGAVASSRRWGRAAYALGEHPLHVLLHAAQRLARPPRLVGGLAYLAGWASAARDRIPRAEPELRAYVRAEQLARVRARLRGSRR